MRILFLGGTSFVGRHTVEAALGRGHEVTFLHRGRTGRGLHPGAERILADRSLDLWALAGREFDAVIDTSGYFPAEVERSTAVLRESAGRYLFVSSQSVYADTSPRPDRGRRVAELPPASPPTRSPARTTARSRRCAKRWWAAFPGPRSSCGQA